MAYDPMKDANGLYGNAHAKLIVRARRAVSRWDNYPAVRLRALMTELADALSTQPAALVEAHETIKRLNRRAQAAEADLEEVPEVINWTTQTVPSQSAG